MPVSLVHDSRTGGGWVQSRDVCGFEQVVWLAAILVVFHGDFLVLNSGQCSMFMVFAFV